MFYYVAYDLEGIKLFETDEDGIIHEFKDENHFYDPEDKLIYSQYSGRKVPTSNYQWEPEEAKKTLLELALENAQNNGDGRVLFQPNQSKKDLIEDIEQFLADNDDIDADLVEVLNNIIKELLE